MCYNDLVNMMTYRHYRAAILVAMACLCSTAWGVQIQLDYSLDTNGFFGDSARRDVMQAVADYFEPHLTDDLEAIVPGGSNSWSAGLFHPATGVWHYEDDITIPADTMVIYVGGRDLGGSTLGQAGPGGYSASGRQSFLTTVGTRGEGTTSGSSAMDFGPWGGSAAFDTETSWYFDVDPSTNEMFSGYDFYSVAIHEMGHILGFGTADSWDNQVASGNPNTFTGPMSVATYGGDVPLHEESHWEVGTASTIGGGGYFETAMDPNIANSQRKLFTDLDWAALDDIGWDVIYPTGRIGDFDGDGYIDADDIDAIGAAVAAASTDLTFDLDGDGVVDHDDVILHVTTYVDTAMGEGTGTFFGDFNLDGAVDLLDLNTLAYYYNGLGGWVHGDANGDGSIQLLDLNTLTANYNSTVVVPEPMTMSLLAIGAVGLIHRRKK
jgi:hypothetical protein